MNRKLILYIAASLDGYIAAPDDDLSFLSVVQKEGEDYGYNSFIANVDTVILGRKTYDWVVKHAGAYPQTDRKTYVVTRSEKSAEGNVIFYNGSLKELVMQLKKENGKNIHCDGGAEIIFELMKHDLIDEFIISVIPVLIGNGTRLFKTGGPGTNLKLVSAKSYETGLVQLHYIR